MGQSPSSQNAHSLQKQARQLQIYEQADPFIVATSESSTPGTSNHARVVDPGLASSAKALQLGERKYTTKGVYPPRREAKTHFCEFCDRPFDSKFALEEHLTVHNPAYQNVVDKAKAKVNAKREAERAEAQRAAEAEETQKMKYSFCRVCDKDFKFEPAKLLNHHDLAEKHRNVRSRRELHPTNDRPELWCALCETRFTHTDRKRKHMAEMNNHNARHRDLEARALRVPNFDRSILERPSPEVIGAMEEEARLQREARDMSSSASASTSTVTATGSRRPAANARAEEENWLHYCAPCDRYFLSSEELALHQSEERCMISASASMLTIERQPSRPLRSSQSTADLPDTVAPQPPPPPLPQLRPRDRSPTPRTTQSMYNISMPVPVPVPTPPPIPVPVTRPTPPRSPSPPPPYEVEDSNTPLPIPAPSSSISNVPPRPPPEPIAVLVPQTSRSLSVLPPLSPALAAPITRSISPSAMTTPNPSVVPTSAATSSSPDGPGIECALCLEREDNLSSLACGHIFGTECIRETLDEDPRCPICREPAVKTDLRRVFLT